MRTQTNDVIASLFLCGKEMEDSGQCASRKFNNLSASILHNERERKCNLCKYRYQGIAQVRTNKSSATSHENASRSSSWFRFNDGIPVLVHCLFLLESAFFLWWLSNRGDTSERCVSQKPEWWNFSKTIPFPFSILFKNERLKLAERGCIMPA